MTFGEVTVILNIGDAAASSFVVIWKQQITGNLISFDTD
jgi:hypothetical protein